MNAKAAPKGQRRRTFLKEWRDFRGLTQEQASERLDITQGQLSRIERGETPYNQDFLEAAAFAYQCTPADLLMRNPLDDTAPWSILDNLQKATPEQQRQAVAVVETLLKTGTGG